MKIVIFGKEINIIWFVIAFIFILVIILAFVASLSSPEKIDPIIGIWKYETSENSTRLTFDGSHNFEANYYSKIDYRDAQIFRGSWIKESNNYYNITFSVPDIGIAHSIFVYNPNADVIYGETLPEHLFKRVIG